MEIRLDLFELKNICMSMAQLGALEAIKAHSPQRDEIKRREAQRLGGGAWRLFIGRRAQRGRRGLGGGGWVDVSGEEPMAG